ncbi:MAG TPA: hypothetical protein VGN63_19385 [Flavisolibacter sp.]|jgi:hypothetical protein|nr:hypothetical protein [Flavisolibacter sp.]
MKRLLYLICCCAASSFAEAQNLTSEIEKYQQDAAYQSEIIQKLKALHKQSDTSIVKPPVQPYYLINPKPGIHRLPQDNMPCIVPDMNATVAIPNTWKGEKSVPFRGTQPRIPNRAKPFNFRPERPLLTYPDKENTK